MTSQDNRRAVIENVSPTIDEGRFPVKRTLGERLQVEADAFCDGHDSIRCILHYRHTDEESWHSIYMTPAGQDHWRANFKLEKIGRYHYRVSAWVDHFESWRHNLARRKDADDIAVHLQHGATLVLQGVQRAPLEDAEQMQAWAQRINSEENLQRRVQVALDPALSALMARYPDCTAITDQGKTLDVVVDPVIARFSSWYEMFPRSAGRSPDQHGTFLDCIERLPYVSALGFDILYLPPIHPIGRVNRKGPNNALSAGPVDPGSPWAIGAVEGGHKSVHPQLGTLDDFNRLIGEARKLGIEIAMDIAFQCAPDHPYVTTHPQWFSWHSDGRVQYAENPSKKYEDIYPFNFDTSDWRSLWQELKSIFDFWIDHGVRIFRVDNPHTKPFALWEYIITEIKKVHPEVLFLAEAFTRPRVMHRLAKLGFSQSYNYFPWRNTKWELTTYLTELTQDKSREYFRPNLWPNTPDILTEYLQFGGRPAFITRFILAATLGASYGIYGPAFELLEREPRTPGSEEYLNSEKYQLRHRDLNQTDSLREMIKRVNQIRREHTALQYDWNLRFHRIDNDQLLAYSKTSDDGKDIVLVVVNLDVYHTQSGWLELPLAELGVDPTHTFQLHDLISQERYFWHGFRNFVQIDPKAMPAHIFQLLRRDRTERDFEYFL